jgi:hypothetical protein
MRFELFMGTWHSEKCASCRSGNHFGVEVYSGRQTLRSVKTPVTSHRLQMLRRKFEEVSIVQSSSVCFQDGRLRKVLLPALLCLRPRSPLAESAVQILMK